MAFFHLRYSNQHPIYDCHYRRATREISPNISIVTPNNRSITKEWLHRILKSKTPFSNLFTKSK